MKAKILILLFFWFVITTSVTAQKLSIAVLGDSYSTFEGYITPSSNETWYYAKYKQECTDVKDRRTSDVVASAVYEIRLQTCH